MNINALQRHIANAQSLQSELDAAGVGRPNIATYDQKTDHRIAVLEDRLAQAEERIEKLSEGLAHVLATLHTWTGDL